jgi:hypothetical protein
MAGDWIKFEHTTPDKPEVIRMATSLNISQDAVVGKLLRVWIWADQNSVAGTAAGITDAFIDRLTGKRGFSAAMRDAGWLAGDDGSLVFSNFDRNNGASAKARAMDNRSKASRRAQDKCPENVREQTGQALDKNPDQRREEKRREEKSNTYVGQNASETKAAPAAPTSDADWLASLAADPTYAGIDVTREYGKMTAWCKAHRKEPTRRRFVNWLNRVDKPMTGAFALMR